MDTMGLTSTGVTVHGMHDAYAPHASDADLIAQLCGAGFGAVGDDR